MCFKNTKTILNLQELIKMKQSTFDIKKNKTGLNVLKFVSQLYRTVGGVVVG